jgi:hypothetical protein
MTQKYRHERTGALPGTRATALAVVCGAILAACASTPPPTEKFALAESAIQRAERAGAQQAAPGELGAAREKLQRAQGVAAKDADAAARLAEESESDATLAESRAQAQRSKNALATVEPSLEALREEAARGSTAGSTTGAPATGAPAPSSDATPLPPSRP